MSAQYPGKKNDSMEDRYPIIVKNESGEDIPALSIAKLKDATGIPINKAQRVTVEKPTGSGQHIFTWPFKIASGKEGRGRLASPMPVNFDGSAPAAGATVGPTSGSWKVSTSGSGYFAVGGAEDGVVLVLNPGGGGSVLRALLRATGPIPERVDDTTPGTADTYDVIKGDCSGDIENWSAVEIPTDSFIVIVQIDGDNVIYNAFC